MKTKVRPMEAKKADDPIEFVIVASAVIHAARDAMKLLDRYFECSECGAQSKGYTFLEWHSDRLKTLKRLKTSLERFDTHVKRTT